MYFALVSSNSADNVESLQTEETQNRGSLDGKVSGTVRGQRKQSSSSTNELGKRLSTEILLESKVSEDTSTCLVQQPHPITKDGFEGPDPQKVSSSSQLDGENGEDRRNRTKNKHRKKLPWDII